MGVLCALFEMSGYKILYFLLSTKYCLAVRMLLPKNHYSCTQHVNSGRQRYVKLVSYATAIWWQ